MAGASAGRKNRPWAFKIPPASAASEMNPISGNIHRASATLWAIVSGANPAASTGT